MEINQVLDAIPWDRYEEEVYLAVDDAIRHYVRGTKGSRKDPVTQVSVWTAPQHRLTAVGFETLNHAISQGGAFVNRPGPGQTPRVELVTYQQPADFEFREYHCVYHPALLGLMRLNFNDGRQARGAMERVEKRLLRVRDRVIHEGMVDQLPKSAVLWIGINSPRDWYDHVLELRCDNDGLLTQVG